MARTDAVVLGAGIVGTSIALHLAKRGLSVALVDKGAPGEGTSYGNAGVIEGNTLLPHPFPERMGAVLRVALKRATDANYHVSFLPHIAPWLLQYRANSSIERRIRFANLMRPLYAAAAPEHEALMQESGATRYLRKEGWIKVYRTHAAYAATARERALASEFGLPHDGLDRDAVLALEPALAPQFVNAVHWKSAASVTNPLALTRAYIDRFTALGGIVLTGDARTLHRANNRWRVETDEGPVDSREAVVALGPWAADLLKPMDIDLPLEVKRGYHLHFQPRGNAGLTRPVVDAELGYCVAPMEQGLRLTTGAEFAPRDAPPTPVQFDRLLPQARALFPLGEKVEAQPWMGSRPCFADSMPVIGRAPGKTDLWLAVGHAHWGLTLGPATGRLVAEMITGATPFCDPTPFAAERFS
ncbi:MAG TPA: FAD-dependent oxidoreductase [Xanthobacteraceae bacterium]|nr:FAD-dependent oxidoreductase [Xanthobacteraceae bacterium]